MPRNEPAQAGGVIDPSGAPSADGPLGREAMGALKARLRDEPRDAVTRAALVGAYRRSGYPDQAGRYAVGLEEGATRVEISAYAAMLRGLGADADTARRLSLIPPEADSPEGLGRALDEAAAEVGGGGGVVWVVIAWVAAFVSVAVTLAVSYGFAMAGSADASSVARTWTIVTGWVLVVALSATTLWCVIASWRRAALVWACMTAAVVVCIGFGSGALLG